MIGAQSSTSTSTDPWLLAGALFLGLLAVAVFLYVGLSRRYSGTSEGERVSRPVVVEMEMRLSKLEGHIERMAKANAAMGEARQITEPAATKAPKSNTDPLAAKSKSIAGGVAEQELRAGLYDLLGSAADEMPIRRFLPISIYLASDDLVRYAQLQRAVTSFVESFGFRVTSRLAAESGSIFGRLSAALQTPSSKKKLREAAQLAELALSQQLVGTRQAAIDEQQAAALAHLGPLITDHDDAILIHGQSLVLSFTDAQGKKHLRTKQLTPQELVDAYREGGAARSLEAARALFSEFESPPLAEAPPDEGDDKRLPPGADESEEDSV